MMHRKSLVPPRKIAGALAVLALTAMPLSALDLKLTDGRILRGAEVGSVSGASISISHDEGVSNIQPEELTEEGRELLKKDIRRYWKRHHKFVLQKVRTLSPDEAVGYLSDEIEKHPETSTLQDWRELLAVAQAMVQARQHANLYQSQLVLEKTIAEHPDADNLDMVRAQLAECLEKKDELAIGKAVLDAEEESDPDVAVAALQEAAARHPKAANRALVKPVLIKLESAALRRAVQQLGPVSEGAGTDEIKRKYEELKALLAQYPHADQAARQEAEQLAAQGQASIGTLNAATERLDRAMAQARECPNLHQARLILEKAIGENPEAPNLAEAQAQLDECLAHPAELAVAKAVMDMEKEPDFATGATVLKEVMAAYPNASNLALAEQAMIRMANNAAMEKALREAKNEADPAVAHSTLQKAVAAYPDTIYSAQAERLLAKLADDVALSRAIQDAKRTSDPGVAVTNLKNAMTGHPASSYLPQARELLAKLEGAIRERERQAEEERRQAEERRRAEARRRALAEGRVLPMIPSLDTFFPFQFGASVDTVREECSSFEDEKDDHYSGVCEDGIKRHFGFQDGRLFSIICNLEVSSFADAFAAMEKRYGKQEWQTHNKDITYMKWILPQYQAAVILVMNTSKGTFGMLMTKQD